MHRLQAHTYPYLHFIRILRWPISKVSHKLVEKLSIVLEGRRSVIDKTFLSAFPWRTLCKSIEPRCQVDKTKSTDTAVPIFRNALFQSLHACTRLFSLWPVHDKTGISWLSIKRGRAIEESRANKYTSILEMRVTGFDDVEIWFIIVPGYNCSGLTSLQWNVTDTPL